MPVIIDNFEIVPEAPPAEPKPVGARPPPPPKPHTPEEVVRITTWHADRMRRVHAD